MKKISYPSTLSDSSLRLTLALLNGELTLLRINPGYVSFGTPDELTERAARLEHEAETRGLMVSDELPLTEFERRFHDVQIAVHQLPGGEW